MERAERASTSCSPTPRARADSRRDASTDLGRLVARDAVHVVAQPFLVEVEIALDAAADVVADLAAAQHLVQPLALCGDERELDPMHAGRRLEALAVARSLALELLDAKLLAVAPRRDDIVGQMLDLRGGVELGECCARGLNPCVDLAFVAPAQFGAPEL